MAIDVADPLRNLVLNACFWAVLGLALVAIVPWGWIGAPRVGRLLRCLPLPALLLAVIYEVAMPARFDIRVDLLLLAPAYAVILLTSLARWKSVHVS